MIVTSFKNNQFIFFTVFLILSGCNTILKNKAQKNIPIEKKNKYKKNIPKKVKPKPRISKEKVTEKLSDSDTAILLFKDFLLKNKKLKNQILIADTNLKIAELYYKNEDDRYEKAMKRYDEVIEKSGFNSLSEIIEPPSYDFLKAIEYYTYIIENFPTYQRLDAVYYGLAYCYYEQNQKELANITFKKLVKKFPNSKLANEANMRIGEYLFTINRFEEAAEKFEEMLNKRNQPYYDIILYKLGWTYFSEGNFSDATDTFLKIKSSGEIKSPISQGLFFEALRYVARIFSGTSGLSGLISHIETTNKIEHLPNLIRFLGDSYKEDENYEKAKETYSKLLKMYPNSEIVPFVAHSIIEINEKTSEGEQIIKEFTTFVKKYDVNNKWFENAKDKAIKGKVLTLVKTAQAKISLYEKSIKSLFSIIDETTGIDDKKNVQQYLKEGQKDIIKNTCYKNIAFIFSNTTGVEGLLEYVSGSVSYQIHLPDLLKSIGSMYKKQGRRWQAVQAYQVLLENYPGIEDAPIIQNKIAQLYEEGNKPEDAIKERKAFVEKFVPGSEWYNIEKINSDRRWGTIALAEKSLRTIALYYHARMQKHKKQEDLKEAEAYYKKYISFFPDHPHLLEITFFFAELLNQFKDPVESIPYYEKVAWAEGNEKKSENDQQKKEKKTKAKEKLKKYRLDAAYELILINEVLKKQENHFGNYSETLIKTIQKYADYFPKNKRTPELLFKAGEILFKVKKFKKAQHFFLRLINSYPQSNLYAEGIRLVAQGYFEVGNYKEAEKWYAAALSSGSKGTFNITDDTPLKKMLASTKFKKAEAMQAKGLLIEAGKEFLEISEITPDRLVASIALFNAGINFKKKKECDMLFKVNSKLLQKYPESRFSKGAMSSYLECEVSNKRWLDGANNIRLFTIQNPLLSQLAEPLLEAAKFYEKFKNFTRALETYRLFTKRFPDNSLVIEAFCKIGDLEYKKNNLLEAKKNYEQSFSVFLKLSQYNDNIDNYYAVKSKFMQGEIIFYSFRNIKITTPVEKSLTKKKEFMEKALSFYTKTADYKIGEWTTAATYKIGAVFEEFKTSLMESEKPKDLSPEEIEDYIFLLEEQAYPFEEKAISAYQANMQRLQSKHIYNKWIANTIDRMAYLFPWSYNKKEKIVKNIKLYTIIQN